MKRHPRRPNAALILAFVLLALFLGALVARKYHTATHKVEPPVQQQPVATTGVVSLFFAAPDGEGLVREGRELELGESLQDRIEAVLDELVSGPVGDNGPTLPGNTRVLSVRLAGELVEVNFSRDLVDGLPAGASAEMAAVYSVVDTLAANFPEVKQVRILVEGVVPETLKGHLDLRRPLVPDYTLEKAEPKTEPKAPPAGR